MVEEGVRRMVQDCVQYGGSGRGVSGGGGCEKNGTALCVVWGVREGCEIL